MQGHLPQAVPRPAVKAGRGFVGVDDPAGARIDEQVDGRVVVEQAAKKVLAGRQGLLARHRRSRVLVKRIGRGEAGQGAV